MNAQWQTSLFFESQNMRSSYTVHIYSWDGAGALFIDSFAFDSGVRGFAVWAFLGVIFSVGVKHFGWILKYVAANSFTYSKQYINIYSITNQAVSTYSCS
jgi:hypothetical protein